MPQSISALCTALPIFPGLFNSYSQCRWNWPYLFFLGCNKTTSNLSVSTHLLTSCLTSWFHSATVSNNIDTYPQSWGYWCSCHQFLVPRHQSWDLRMSAWIDCGNQNISCVSVMLLSICETGGHWTVRAKVGQNSVALHRKQLHCRTPTRCCRDALLSCWAWVRNPWHQ